MVIRFAELALGRVVRIASRNHLQLYQRGKTALKLALMAMLQFRRRQLLSCQRVTAANSFSSKAVGAKGPLFLGWAFWLAALYNKCYKFIRR